MGSTATSVSVAVIVIVVPVIMLHLTRLILRIMVVLGLMVRRLLRVLRTTRENAHLTEVDRKFKKVLLNEKIINNNQSTFCLAN